MADPDYTVKQIDDLDAAFGGAFKRVRAELGVESFGVQVVELPPNSGELYPEHDHLHDGQEEVYVVLQGAGEMQLADESVRFDQETVIRVGPATRRRIRSGPGGIRVLAIGGIPGEAYTPQANSEIGGPEVFASPTARSSLVD